MTTIETVIAREEIREVTLRYARGVDRLDWDLVRSCYHPDAFDHHGTYQGGIDGFIEFFREQCKFFEGTMHLLANCLIELEDGDSTARSESYCIAHHWTAPRVDGFELVTGARYLDRFERREGSWKIAHRRCVIDWTRKSPLTSWGLVDRFLRGARGRVDPLYHWDDDDRSGGHDG